MVRLNKKTGKKLNTIQYEFPDSFNLPEVSERRYQDLFNNASDAIFIHDLNGNTIEVNEAAVNITGYTHNELTGMNVSEFLTAKSFKATMKKQKALLKDETATQRYELEIIRKDGVRITAESRTSLLTHKGRPIGVQCIVRDITQRKRVEKELQESKEKYKTLFQSKLDGLLVIDETIKPLLANQAAAEMFGFHSAEELLDVNPFDYIPPEEKERVLTIVKKDMFENDLKQVNEFRLTNKYGKETWISAVGTLTEYQGKVAGLVSFRDITQRKRIEETLQESKEKYQALFENLNDAAFLADMKTGRILDTNKQGELLLGRTREEIIGIHQTKLHPPEMANEYRQRFLAHTQKGRAADYDGEVIRKDGSIVSVSISASPINIGDKELILGLFRDITERKQAEEALRESQQNFRNSLDSSPLGIRIVTAEGELLYANQAILDIYGYSSVEELKSVPTERRYTPKSYAEYQGRKAKRKQREPVPADYEIGIVRKDGEVRHLAVFRKAVIWGGEIQFQTLYQDITEQKLTAEKLRRFRAISDRAGYGAGIITPEGDLTYVNESFAGMHEYAIEELIGKHFSILHTKEQMRATERFRKKLMQEGGFLTEEVWHKKKDGTVFPTLMTGTAIKDDMGELLYLSATLIDITERKRVEIALQRSEEFNSSLLTNSPCPILVLNADASIRYVNPALEKLTGFSAAELVGSKPPYPWWLEKTREDFSRRLVRAMHRGTRRYESLYRKKNGERFWVEKTFKTVKVNGEFKYHLVNWVDLTERKRSKANMELYLSEVSRAQEEERKRIAREIHDESIQSLATLALGIDAITREKERLPEDVIRRLKGLRAETNSILDGLRRFSHELRPGVIDNIGLVPALEILTEELNKENRVKTSLEIMGSEQRLVPETELALFRIAQEALRNVKKHSRATQCVIKLKFTREKVQLTVSDNGRGFEAPDTLSDLATEHKLGLIGMQERTRLLNGKLFVRSRLGRGTTVVVQAADIQGMKG